MENSPNFFPLDLSQAQARSEGSSEYYEDVAGFLDARKTLNSFKLGFSVGINMKEVGLSGSKETQFLHNISQYASEVRILFMSL